MTWVTTEHQLDLQKQIIAFLLKAYGGVLSATLALFLLQGFQFGGFHLDPGLLTWLGGATVGAVAGLLTLTFGAVFQRRPPSGARPVRTARVSSARGATRRPADLIAGKHISGIWKEVLL